MAAARDAIVASAKAAEDFFMTRRERRIHLFWILICGLGVGFAGLHWWFSAPAFALWRQ